MSKDCPNINLHCYTSDRQLKRAIASRVWLDILALVNKGMIIKFCHQLNKFKELKADSFGADSYEQKASLDRDITQLTGHIFKRLVDKTGVFNSLI